MIPIYVGLRRVVSPRKSYHRNAEATVAMTDASPSARRARLRATPAGVGPACAAPARGGPERVWPTGRAGCRRAYPYAFLFASHARPAPGARKTHNLPQATCRLSPGLDNSTGNSTATRQATRQVARQLLDRPRQNTPDSMRRRRQVSSSTARQLDRPHQNSTDLDRAEPIRTSLLETHSFKVKVDGDPLVNYTTWWLDDGFTSGGPFEFRSRTIHVRFVRSCSF